MDENNGRMFRELNPDELQRFYEEDPVLFRKLSREAIEAACVGKNDQQTIRLQRMQWVIDGSLRKGKTPLQKLQIMEEIFYGRVYGDDGLLAQLKERFADVRVHLRGSGDAPAKGAKYIRRVLP